MKRYIRQILILGAMLIFGFSVSGQSGKLIRRVVIDAGHGGKDPGASGKNHKEKTLSLDIALKTGHYIEKYMPDVEVIYTRKTDKFIKLHERARIANESHADLFISIHCNANNSPRIYGAETYVMGLHKNQANLEVAKLENAAILQEEDYVDQYEGFDPNAPEAYILFSLYQSEFLDHSLNFASKVQDQFRERVGLKDRSVMQAGFLVLYKTAMPSVLIETGYLTNAKDEQFLASEDGKVYIASAIYRAFKEYKKEMEKDYTPAQIIAASLPVEPEEETVDDGPAMPDNNPNPPVVNTATQALAPKENIANGPNRDKTDVVYFRVQFATSKKDKPVDRQEFKGLQDVRKYHHASLYKFTSGNFAGFPQANQYKNQLREKGYKDAFVVAFLNDERISLGKARKLASR